MSKITIVKDAAEKAVAAESDRTRHLLRNAEKLIAAGIIVISFQLAGMITLLESSTLFVNILCFLALLALTLSLLFGFLSMRLKGYAGYPRGDKLWEYLKSETISDNDAELAVIQLLLKTREQNAKLNDAKTGSLIWCGWLFFAGFLLVIGSRLLDVIANV